MSKNVKTKIVTAVATISLLCPLALQATPMVASADWIDDATEANANDAEQAAHNSGASMDEGEGNTSTKPSTSTPSKPSTPSTPSNSTPSAPSHDNSGQLPPTNNGSDKTGSVIVNNGNAAADSPTVGTVGNDTNSQKPSTTKPTAGSSESKQDSTETPEVGKKPSANKENSANKDSKNKENNKVNESITPATEDKSKDNSENTSGFGENAQGSHSNLDKGDKKIPQTSTDDDKGTTKDWIDDATDANASDAEQAAHNSGASMDEGEESTQKPGKNEQEDNATNDSNEGTSIHKNNKETVSDTVKAPEENTARNDRAIKTKSQETKNSENAVNNENPVSFGFGKASTSNQDVFGQKTLPQTSTVEKGMFAQLIEWIVGLFK